MKIKFKDSAVRYVIREVGLNKKKRKQVIVHHLADGMDAEKIAELVLMQRKHIEQIIKEADEVVENKLFVFRCADCGDSCYSPQMNAILCDRCRKMRDRGYKKKKKDTNIVNHKTIGEVLQLVDEYNRNHRKRISYGEYVQRYGV